MTTLLAAAHGTRSPTGLATIRRLMDVVRDVRPGLVVDLCFLDVLEPSLRNRVTDVPGPAVVVPVLLSTGYHVLDDIPAVVADRSDIAVARHLGPHPLLTTALVDRLREADGVEADRVVLVGSPSRRSEAVADLAAAAADLSGALERPVEAASLDDLPESLARLPGRVAVASYLLAEGHFHETLRARSCGAVAVSAPLGAHPALARLILERYDAVRP